ncbi:MAG: hypothetical protein HOQ11_10315 [Gemmatimonadaceae bacterium]|nr:hypothetical protein [Gemmatimonadaceae bacterium]NUQ92118.1 hypothetical protein [Gemmatimonadaceae bacterium]NUR18188.1 hypothetical protein [Gemmatimonadaceae bacterium]NUS97785.1 hypothetical protein [Gemmatimonadaceae bacterium]
MEAPAIRPRSAIEIVDVAFSIFRSNFATMAVIGLAASVPFVILISLGVFSMASLSPRSLEASMMAMLPMLVTVGLVAVLWMSVIDGAMTFAAAEAYHGNRPSPGDAIRGALSKGISLVGGNVLRVLIIGAVALLMGVGIAVLGKLNAFLGFIVAVALLVLFVHVIARTFAITSAIVIERKDAMDGVSRSFALSRDSTLRIIGVGFLCLCVYWVAQVAGALVVQLVIGFILRNPIVAAIIGNLVGMLMYPFLNIALMVLYFDQRVRKEGYDIDVLSSAMAPAPQS